MNKNPIEITAAEAEVVKSLLELYEAAWADGDHSRGCLCKFCKAIETAGNHDASLFDSLSEKVGKRTNTNDTDAA